MLNVCVDLRVFVVFLCAVNAGCCVLLCVMHAVGCWSVFVCVRL